MSKAVTLGVSLVAAALLAVGCAGTLHSGSSGDTRSGGVDSPGHVSSTEPDGATSSATMRATATRPASTLRPAPRHTTAVPSADPVSTVPTSTPAEEWPQIDFDRWFYVAYYGTAHTPAMGILGEAGIPAVTQRLRSAAEPYRASGKKVQIAYELVATIADRVPGPHGRYNHDLSRTVVQAYIDAAKANHALLILDIQPGQEDFESAVRRWAWALRYPHVEIALDPEWRMGRGEVPGERIGSVDAEEVNRASRFVSELVRRHDLPPKMFLLHQFTTDMIRHAGQIRQRPGLVMALQADGFGSPAQKAATYHKVAKPDQFHMGFKLFYQQDSQLMSPQEVLRLRPHVEFVTYQ